MSRRLALLLAASLALAPLVQSGVRAQEGSSIETTPLPQVGDETEGNDLLIDRDPFGLHGTREDSPLQRPEGTQDMPLVVRPENVESPQEGDAARGLSEEERRQEPAPPENRDLKFADAPKARLRALDTMTNTVNDFIVEVGQTVAFKRLIITLEACRYPEGDIEKDAYAFLRIRDEREKAPRFSGWMIASSPALSALDHPRYDVWVLSCKID